MSDKDTLKHYASQYYDPQKAHEYYIRTRQLKGKTGPKKETTATRQQEGIAYVTNQINSKRDSDLTSLKSSVDAAKADITGKIGQLLSQKQAEFLALPAGASAKQLAFMRQQLDIKYNKIGTQLKSALSSAVKTYAANRKSVTTNAKTTLKTEVNNIRTQVR